MLHGMVEFASTTFFSTSKVRILNIYKQSPIDRLKWLTQSKYFANLAVRLALMSNGRENPIIKLINATRNKSKYVAPLENSSRGKASQNRRWRIISVFPSGVAFFGELNFSFWRYTDSLPPFVSFDGLVAADSCKGLPVKYLPTLSPTR